MKTDASRDSARLPGSANAGRWDPCFVDPWRGVAHFDGITIEADPITSARPDRVLPCIADEQVFFCRMLRQILRGTRARGTGSTRRRALDFGTGSGVLGIAAAALGLEVTGIDVSQRAIDSAASNLNRRENRETIERGGGRFEELRSGDVFADESLGNESWDYILLNPPFALVTDEWQAPGCVDGGADGQHNFLESVRRAGQLLKPGGRLFAVHLVLTDERGRPAVLESLEAADWESLTVFPAYPDEPLYALDAFERRMRGDAEVASSSASEAHLCLAFVELRKRRHRAERPVRFQFCSEVPVTPPTEWESRLAMHRAVLNASPRLTPATQRGDRTPSCALLPAGEYFLARTTPFLGSATRATPAPAWGAADSAIEKALLQWIQANELIAPAGTAERDSAASETGPYFDVIMIEAAPWYLTGNANTKLRSSTILVCAAENERPATKALTDVLECIQHINTENRSIFRHPEQESYLFDRWHAAIAAQFRFDVAALDVVNAHEKPGLTLKPQWFSEGRIGAACQAAILDSLKVPKDNPSELPFDHCLEKALRDFTGAVVTNDLVGPGDVTCYIVGIPLPPTNVERPSGAPDSAETGAKRATEDKRTGFVYVYGWSSRRWSPAAESQLVDLAGIAGLMHEESWASAAELRLQQVWKGLAYRDALGHARHELTYVVKALKHAQPQEAIELLRALLGAHLLIDEPDSAPILEELATSPGKLLPRLWSDCFVVHMIAKLGRVDSDDLRVWRLEAEKLAAADKIPRLGVAGPTSEASVASDVPLEKRKIQLRHFYAALMAALSNAAKWASDPDLANKEPTVSFRMDPEFVEVSSTYWYGEAQLADTLRARGKKRLDAKANTYSTGTENVLRYHAEKYGVSTADRLLIVDRLSEPSRGHCKEGIRWTARVPRLPYV